jgi:hypothetical protein
MFKKAYNIANQYTKPMIVAMKYFDDTVESGLGSFIILNDEGWLLTAAHNFGPFFAFTQHQQAIKEYQEKVKEIRSNFQLKESTKQAQLQHLKPNDKWVTEFAIFLNGSLINIIESHIYQEHDLALFKIHHSVIEEQEVFPKIKNPQNISPGTSLCKLGFPFIEVNATFDEIHHQFILPPNLLPVPMFPIDGIYTRNLLTGRTADGKMDIMFLETSSPGLKGQSGGPIFDTDGNIYAIQSQNITLQLGFKGIVEINGKKIEENQFLNVGIGVHPNTIVSLLRKHNIKFMMAD